MPGGLRRCGKVFPSSPSSLLGLIQVRSDHPWQLRFAQGRQQSPESTNDAWCNPTPSTTLLRMLMDDSSEQGCLQPLCLTRNASSAAKPLGRCGPPRRTWPLFVLASCVAETTYVRSKAKASLLGGHLAPRPKMADASSSCCCFSMMGTFCCAAVTFQGCTALIAGLIKYLFSTNSPPPS